EGWCATGGHAAGADLQHRRKSLGPIHVVAAGMRFRLRRDIAAAVPDAGLRSFVLAARGVSVSAGVRRVRLRSREASALSAAARTVQRHRRVAAMAGGGSAGGG